MADHQIDTRLAGIQRLTNSRDGNPRFRLVFDGGGSAITAPDSACNYEVESAYNRGQIVRLTLDKSGRVYRIEEVSNV